jgi:hypothetical protein
MKQKEDYLKSLNDDLQTIQNEIKKCDLMKYKLRDLILDDKMIKNNYLCGLMENINAFD